MNHPYKIYPINFAGFFDLKDEPFYESKSLLNIEDYPDAKEFADEVCLRWDYHIKLVNEIEQLILHAEEDSLTYSVLEHARKLVFQVTHPNEQL